ncbi:ATP-dependent RNA helicase RhlE [Adhaeribacter aerolatus]|uniref:ATP-dependent RNA helicase RhlE n=1 Tax=Adhaeribacter aerolatus TaxID=670289 RepID=A0A512AWG9_9BACT|nr:DEAD/DEAH box helicase [Adhaeribacter aerolatus]GEO04062.1 ATP-dependent RNA helicase RhlE [Adhaeribacter aerolatus]
MDFSQFGLSAPLLKAINAQGYQQPYPIQEQTIPAILAGHDILGIAPTGSGKTAGFALPMLEQFRERKPTRNRFVQALVLVPTRELALQVATVFQGFSLYLGERVKTLAVFGGVSINPQMKALSGTDILVATPGRLLDLIENRAVHLSAVAVLVLDEADKMLNLGFAEEVDRILKLLPPKRQNLLFSATLADDIKAIKERMLRNPVVISVAETPTNEGIDLIRQVAYRVSSERKGPFLRYLLKHEEMAQVLIFVSSTRNADNLVVKLNKNGIEAMALHGDKSQGARTEALRRFKTGQLRALVATDLASRGIDIQLLPFVINYDLPRSPKDYVHRIGRTGRAGATGEAISLITPEDEHHFKIIQKKMGKTVEVRESAGVNMQGI